MIPDSIPSRKSEFISVEIAITTDFDSDAYIKWFEAQDHFVAKVPAESHKWYIYFAPIPNHNANTTIFQLCEMIRNLPPEVREAWDRAARREFFAGYQVGDEPFCFAEHLEPDTLKAALDLKAGIGWALYPSPPSNEDEGPMEKPKA